MMAQLDEVEREEGSHREAVGSGAGPARLRLGPAGRLQGQLRIRGGEGA